MSERTAYEPGVPCWVTALQPDCAAGARFYGGLFGWDTVYSDDPDAAAERARAAGGEVLAEPFDVTGGRLAVIADPAGAVFGVWRGRGAQLVNEPGAWAMSTLHTPDPTRAAEFY